MELQDLFSPFYWPSVIVFYKRLLVCYCPPLISGFKVARQKEKKKREERVKEQRTVSIVVVCGRFTGCRCRGRSMDVVSNVCLSRNTLHLKYNETEHSYKK